MKTVKIILAVLLLVALLPTSGCVFDQVHSDTALKEEFEALPIESLTAVEIRSLPDVEAKLNSTTSSLSFLLVCTFLFVLAAGIIAIAWKKKFYGALTSGILVLIPYIWNSSLQSTIHFVAKEPVLRRLENVTWYENTSTMSLANLMLFLPMTGLLAIGVIEMVVYFVKKMKKAPVTESASDETETVEAAPKDTNIDELKKYKDLLDQGIITQEEFEEKKKQLLGL